MKIFSRQMHRRVGVVACLWLLMVAITGLLLQHSDDLKLHQKKMNWAWALKFYGIPLDAWGPAFTVGERIVVQRGSRVAWGEHVISSLPCEILRGAFLLPSPGRGVALVFESEIWQFDENFKLVDRQLQVDGLPVPLQKVVMVGDRLHVESQNKAWSSDWPDFEKWTPEATKVDYLEPQNIQPSGILEAEGLDWERVLLDLHAGRWLGIGGKWASDLSALALIYLIVSGLCLYYRFPQNR